jgi:hypothetical protein
MRCGELTGDAELKMDWTEPPTELDVMGFCSDCRVFGDDQIAAWADCWGMLAVVPCSEVVRFGAADRGDEVRMRPSARCQAARYLGTPRSEVLQG